jgi:hypothetical protein
MKGVPRTSVTTSKDETCESWGSNKEKRCIRKGYVTYSTK